MPTFDNAWLNARRGAFTGARNTEPDTYTDIMHSPEEQARRMALADGDGSDPVAEARAFLNNSRLDPINVRDVAEVDNRLSANRADYDRRMNAPGAVRPWSFQDITQGLASTGQGMQAASLASLLPGIARPLGVPLAAAGEILQAPENIRAGIEDPSQAMGVGEGALRIGGLLLGRGVGARQPKPTGAGAKGEFSPWQAPAARPVTPRPSTPAARPSMADPWSNTPLGRAGIVAEDAVPASSVPTPQPAGFSDRWLREMQASGARTVPPMRPELQALGEGEDAWSSLRTLATRKETAAGDPFGSTRDFATRRTGNTHPWFSPVKGQADMPRPDEIMRRNLLSEGAETDLSSELAALSPRVLDQLADLSPSAARRLTAGQGTSGYAHLPGVKEPVAQTVTKATTPVSRPHRKSLSTFMGPRLKKPSGPASSHGPDSSYHRGVKYDTSMAGDAQTAAKTARARALLTWAKENAKKK